MTIPQLKTLIVSARQGLDISQPDEMADVVAALAETEFGAGLIELSEHILQYTRLPLSDVHERSMKLMLEMIAGIFRLGYVVGKAYQQSNKEMIQ